MTMTEDDTRLDQLFAQARQDRPALPDDLAVRILTDAEAVRLDLAKPKRSAPRSVFRRMVEGIGGWQGLSGLAAASVAGLWIGFAAPDFLPDAATYLYGSEATFALADLDTSFLEDAE